jgi:uncharacterized membrane protein YkvA (DUF1232 family)
MLKDRFLKAFNVATKSAESIAKDGKAANAILEQAYEKAGKNRLVLGAAQEDFFAAVRMLKASFLGAYKGVPWKSVVSALGAILYFVNPLDVVPDFFAGVGFFDDLTVLGFALTIIRGDLDAFRLWEKSRVVEKPQDGESEEKED